MILMVIERLQKWRERQALKRALREPGERQEREFKFKRELERAKHEAGQLRAETEHLKTLTEIQKARAEVAQAKRTLAPRRYGGARKILGQLGEVGARQTAALRGEKTHGATIGFGRLNLLGTPSPPPPKQPGAMQSPAPKPLRFGIKLPSAQPGPLISPFYPRRKKKGK